MTNWNGVTSLNNKKNIFKYIWFSTKIKKSANGTIYSTEIFWNIYVAIFYSCTESRKNISTLPHTQKGRITGEQNPNVHQIVIAYIQMYYTKLYDLKEN